MCYLIGVNRQNKYFLTISNDFSRCRLAALAVDDIVFSFYFTFNSKYHSNFVFDMNNTHFNHKFQCQTSIKLIEITNLK